MQRTVVAEIARKKLTLPPLPQHAVAPGSQSIALCAGDVSLCASSPQVAAMLRAAEARTDSNFF
jgi:hypothetical protein